MVLVLCTGGVKTRHTTGTNHMKKFTLLFLLLHVSATNASIGSTLTRHLRTFYDGPLTNYVLGNGIREVTEPLPVQYVSQVQEVLQEMGLDPQKVELLMVLSKEDIVEGADEELWAELQLCDASSCGSALIFLREFFETNPPAQRRSLIGHEASHIKHFDTLKLIIAEGMVPLTLATAALISSSIIVYKKIPDWVGKTTGRMWWARVGATLCISYATFLLTWELSSHAGSCLDDQYDVEREKRADLESATILQCAQDAANRFEKERQENLAVRDKILSICTFDDKGRILNECSLYGMKLDDISDAEGNDLLDTEHPKLTDRIAYLRELAAEQEASPAVAPAA